MSAEQSGNFKKTLRACTSRLAQAAIVAGFVAGVAAAEPQDIEFDMPAQSLEGALKDYGVATNRQVMVSTELVEGKDAPATVGIMTPNAALEKILDGSGLAYRVTDTGVVLIGDPNTPRLAPAANPGPGAAETGNGSSGGNDPSPAADEPASEEGAMPEETNPAQMDDAIYRQNTVTVTARKKGESDLDVPIVINAYGQEEIQRRGVQDLTDLAAITPSLNISANFGAASGGLISMRGVGASAFNAATDQAVALNLDGMTVTGGTAIRFAQFDLERIEVLKGPQSLYFGKNTSAGIISVVSADPTDEYYSMLRAGYTFGSRATLTEAVVSGPLADGLSARLAFYRNDMDGYLYNPLAAGNITPPQDMVDVFGPLRPIEYKRTPDSLDTAVRGTLKYEPNNDLTFKLKAAYGTQEGASSNAFAQYYYCPAGVPAPGNPGNIPGVGECDIDDTAVPLGQTTTAEEGASGYFQDGRPYFDAEQGYIVGNIDYRLTDDISFNSFTGYYKQSVVNTNNATFTPYPAISAGDHAERENFAQELRLSTDFASPLNGMFGVYYAEDSVDTSTEASLYIPGVLPFPSPQPVSDYFIDGRTYAAFGELTYEMFDGKLELSAGGRYTDEKKDVKVFSRAIGAFVSDLPTDTVSSKRFTPEVTASWRPTPGINVFATYKKGSKSGGFNSDVLAMPPFANNDISFDDEKVEGIEGGIKSVLLDGALRLDLTAYDYDYKDLQVGVFDPVTATQLTRNAASADIRGIEFASNYSPRDIPGFSLSGAVNYSDARFSDYLSSCYVGQTVAEGCAFAADGTPVTTGGVLQDLSGRPTTKAPDWTGNISANYETPVNANETMLGMSLGANYTGNFYTIDTQPPNSRQDSVVLVDAQLRLFNEERGWELAVIGKNLTDKLRIQQGVETPFTPGPLVNPGTGTAGPGIRSDLVGFTNAPRTVMVRLTVEPSAFFRAR